MSSSSTYNFPVTYFSGFQEPISKDQPGEIIRDITNEQWRTFQRIILPWDPTYRDPEAKFSLQAVKDEAKIVLWESLHTQQIIIGYSLPLFL